ncbi:hypothetical protein Dda_5180 [Drechslerella dactyloides]|uniref:Uncharacterized protein n=1 Tax=Drechslerella dactyloides TaxID=74499 RepID=A0AAD6IVT1_DREDA|nr:hypothetical protein Dda_5180 [Drechslerella dactyloides]
MARISKSLAITLISLALFASFSFDCTLFSIKLTLNPLCACDAGVLSIKSNFTNYSMDSVNWNAYISALGVPVMLGALSFVTLLLDGDSQTTTPAPEAQSETDDGVPHPFYGDSRLLFAYAQALRPFFTPETNLLAVNKALYVAPLFEDGIPIEQPNYVEMMNYHTWLISDTLLPDSSPIWHYNERSYFGYYNEYLDFAAVATQLPASSDQEAKARMIELWSNLKEASDDLERIKSESIQKYMTYIDATSTQSTPWDNIKNLSDWVEAHDERYKLVQRNLQFATQLYNQARIDYYGPEMSRMNTLLEGVAKARQYLESVPGYNMPCVDAERTRVDRLLDAKGISTTDKEAKLDRFYKPSYRLKDYDDTVISWNDDHLQPNHERIVVLQENLLKPKHRQVRWQDLGFKNIRQEFRQGEKDVREAETTLNMVYNKQNISIRVEEIAITFSGIKSFDITRGNWHENGFRESYPKLRSDARNYLREKVVRPSNLLFGYGMQLEFTLNFGDNGHIVQSMQQFDGVVFGVPRPFMNRNGTFHIALPDPGYPYLLAVLGDRV